MLFVELLTRVVRGFAARCAEELALPSGFLLVLGYALFQIGAEPQDLMKLPEGQALPHIGRRSRNPHSARSAGSKGARNAAQVATIEAVSPDTNTASNNKPSEKLPR